MRVFLKNKADVVQFVAEELERLSTDSALTMTISPGSSGGYSVNTVTDASSEDIVLLLGKFYFDRHMNTY
jgi:hypothetical protein